MSGPWGPSNNKIWDGSAWKKMLGLTGGEAKVAITDEAAAAFSATNGLPVRLTDDTAFISKQDVNLHDGSGNAIGIVGASLPVALFDDQSNAWTTANPMDVVLSNGTERLVSPSSPLPVAGNFHYLFLQQSDPVPTGSDILDDAAANIVAGDLRLRDTTVRYFTIPYGIKGYKQISIFPTTTPGFGETVQLRVFMQSWATNYQIAGISVVLDVTIPTTAVSFSIGSGGAVGQGGSTGTGTVVSGDHYSVPALAMPCRSVIIEVTAGGVPATGDLFLGIMRTA